MGKVRSCYVVATDIEKSVGFYEALLGVPLAFRDENKWAQFPPDTGRFAVSSRQEAATPQASSVIVFEVADLLETEAIIRQHGGSIIGRREMEGHGATVTFADPDGNVAQIFARIRKSAPDPAL